MSKRPGGGALRSCVRCHVGTTTAQHGLCTKCVAALIAKKPPRRRKPG
jgi:hypothetical protein